MKTNTIQSADQAYKERMAKAIDNIKEVLDMLSMLNKCNAEQGKKITWADVGSLNRVVEKSNELIETLDLM